MSLVEECSSAAQQKKSAVARRSKSCWGYRAKQFARECLRAT
jgi:hypothetical protein